MRRSRAGALAAALSVLALLAGCSDEGPSEPREARAETHSAEQPASQAPASDGGAATPVASDAAPVPAPDTAERLEDFHLDPSGIEYEMPERPRPRGKARPIELMLRSTPQGARAAVDGVPIGRTPALWRGNADGRPHDFTFVKPGYSMARYRFIPTQSGVVHGTLKRLPVPQKKDAGAGERKRSPHPASP